MFHFTINRNYLFYYKRILFFCKEKPHILWGFILMEKLSTRIFDKHRKLSSKLCQNLCWRITSSQQHLFVPIIDRLPIIMEKILARFAKTSLLLKFFQQWDRTSPHMKPFDEFDPTCHMVCIIINQTSHNTTPFCVKKLT